jgi:hypothetical protein
LGSLSPPDALRLEFQPAEGPEESDVRIVRVEGWSGRLVHP